MTDDKGMGSHPLSPNARPGLSRRHFMYGTTAAAAGAVVFRQMPRPALGRAGRAAAAGLAAGADGLSPLQTPGFAFVQAGPEKDGSGQVALTLGAASAAGNLLVATVLSNEPSIKFTGPAGWQRAKEVVFPAAPATPVGRVEIWYYPGTPPSPGCPKGITSATFTGSGDCRGSMSEFSLPGGSVIAVLDSPGQATGTSGGSFSLAAASGNAAGDLGIAVVADFFGSSVSGTWAWATSPTWTGLRHVGSAAHCWSSWYDPNLSGTAPQSLGATFSVTSGEWGFAYAAFRAVAFQPLWMDGGEMATMVALDPTGQELIMGGDVEGLWRTADFGNHWQLSQDGLYGKDWRCTASVAWSQLEANTVYACVGKNANASTPDGGLLVSADGGITWSMRSTQVQFEGNDAGVRPSGEARDADRSTGRLLAQDDTNPGTPYLYAATYNGGVARSAGTPTVPVGTNWTVTGLSATGFYPRALVLNPSNNQELWAGTWDSDGTGAFGGIWHCTTAQTATATGNPNAWSQLGNAPTGTCSDLKVIGGYLYAAFTTLGIYRHLLGSSAWTPLNGGPVSITNGQIWTSLDGYVDSAGNHQIAVASSSGKAKTQGYPNFTNVVLITIAPGGAVSYTDLTGQATINLQFVPPDNQQWWRFGSGFTYWLGGKDFVNPHVLIDPADTSTIYVAGAGGFFYTNNASQGQQDIPWSIAPGGMPMCACFLIAADPGTPSHVILAGDDFPQLDLTDPTGWVTGDVQGTGLESLVGPVECHAVAFDPSSNVFTGLNTKYGQPTGGAVLWRQAGDSTFTWHDTGYSAALDPGSKPASTTAAAPLGLWAGVAGTPYIVVVSQGDDVWRAIPGTGGVTQPWTWTQLSTGIGTNGTVGQHCPIVAGNNAGYLYCYDRTQGVYRSQDHGQSWAQIWNTVGAGITVSDARSGWLAVNPVVNGELWVSASTGLYKVSNAGSVTTVGPNGYTTVSSGTFPDGAGGIVFDSSGNVYAVALNGPSLTSAQIVWSTAASDGASWTSFGDSSFGSYASWPGPVALASDVNGQPIIMVGTDENFAVYGPLPT